jgi:hypothetical protein
LGRSFIVVSLVYGALLFEGQAEGTIRLQDGEPIRLDSDNTSGDEALARALQANEPEWEV